MKAPVTAPVPTPTVVLLWADAPVAAENAIREVASIRSFRIFAFWLGRGGANRAPGF
jgi:hypothetical protein